MTIHKERKNFDKMNNSCPEYSIDEIRLRAIKVMIRKTRAASAKMEFRRPLSAISWLFSGLGAWPQRAGQRFFDNDFF